MLSTTLASAPRPGPCGTVFVGRCRIARTLLGVDFVLDRCGSGVGLIVVVGTGVDRRRIAVAR